MFLGANLFLDVNIRNETSAMTVSYANAMYLLSAK